MELIELLKSEYLSIIFGGVAGIITAWVTQRVLNKRGVFRYYVDHNRVGMSAKDSIFGDVQITWNQTNIDNLFLSTIELRNESLNDYEDVLVQTFTDDTNLLTERTAYSDSPNILEWTERYEEKIHVTEDQQFTQLQRDIYFGQREYIIPIFNRGQSVTITYLNTPKHHNTPNIWLTVEKKGVRVKYRVPQNKILGISQPLAALSGVIIGIICLLPTVIFITNSWVVVFAAFIYGLIAQIPGALAIKALKKMREFIGS